MLVSRTRISTASSRGGRSPASGPGPGGRGECRPTTSAGTSGTKGETPGASRVTSRPTSRSWTGCSWGAHSVSTRRSPSRRRSCQLPPSSRAIRTETSRPGSAASVFHSSTWRAYRCSSSAPDGGTGRNARSSRPISRDRSSPNRTEAASMPARRRSCSARASSSVHRYSSTPSPTRPAHSATRGQRPERRKVVMGVVEQCTASPAARSGGRSEHAPAGPTGWKAAGRPTAARGAADAPP